MTENPQLITDNPPQLQTPASMQINILRTVLSLRFFHYKILYFLPFATETHMIKNSDVPWPNITKKEPSPYPMVQGGKSQIPKGLVAAEVSGCRAALWLEGGRRGNYTEINRYFDKLPATFL